MKVAIISSHAWPLPSPARGGDSQILLDLTRTLAEFGHDVFLYAPKGTKAAPGVVVREMPLCSMGTASPKTEECERATVREYLRELVEADVIHDCSVNKSFAEAFPDKALSTHWGGALHHPRPARNVVAQSHAQRGRLLRGETDYAGTETPNAGGPNVDPIADARVVWNGIDTDAPGGYAPTGKAKQDFFLMLGRWHVVRGVEQGIELAKRTGINLLIAGTDPEEDHPAQAAYARKICDLVREHDNISVEFLPMGFEAHHRRKVELYSEARALLFLPQFQEPFGLSMVEAMACGTPVVGLDMGSVREVIGSAYTRETMLMKAVEQRGAFAPLSPWRRQKVSDAARKRAVELFDRKVMAANYFKAYEDVIAGRGWG